MPRTQTRVRPSTEREETRKGIEGWCIACRLPITKGHVDTKGNWIGCQAVGVPADTPFLLIPDRRFFVDRRLTPNPSEAEVALVGTAPQPRRRAPAPVSAAPVAKAIGKPRGLQGPQVVYVARYPLTDSGVENLPDHDRKVYTLIHQEGEKGAQRKRLLEATDTVQQTGRTDAAIRRMRLKKLIEVRPYTNGNNAEK